MPPDPGNQFASASLVGSFGLLCGYIAAVIAIVWRGHDCHDPHCTKMKGGK